MKRNLGTQFYKGIPLKADNKKQGRKRNSKRFIINNSNEYVWINNIYLNKDWSLKSDIDIDWLFRIKIYRKKLIKAGISNNLMLQLISINLDRAV